MTLTEIFFDAIADTGKRISLITPAAFMPLWAGIKLEEDKACLMIEKYLLNPEFFFGDIPFQSVAYNQL